MISIYGRDQMFTDRVAEVKRDIADIKSAQNVAGDSIVLYNNQTSNTWDAVGTVTIFDAQAVWRVTFTPDTPSATYAEIGFNWSASPSADEFNNVYAFDDPSDIAGGATKSFLVGLIPNNTSATTTISLKFNIRASSTGTISWTRII